MVNKKQEHTECTACYNPIPEKRIGYSSICLHCEEEMFRKIREIHNKLDDVDFIVKTRTKYEY